MRLIDADAMLKRNKNSIYDTTDLEEMLHYEPTAYDVDKVIVNLMNSTYVDEEKCYFIPEETFAIVKRGGKDE